MQIDQANNASYRAQAWSGSTTLLDEVNTSMYWTEPLRKLGEQGWELVATAPGEMALFAPKRGLRGQISQPSILHFFLKRPAE